MKISLCVLSLLYASISLGQDNSFEGSYSMRNEFSGKSLQLKDGRFKEITGGCTHSAYAEGHYIRINDSTLILYYDLQKTSSVKLNSRIKPSKEDTLYLRRNPDSNRLEVRHRFYWRIKYKSDKEFYKDYRENKRETKKYLRQDQKENRSSEKKG